MRKPNLAVEEKEYEYEPKPSEPKDGPSEYEPEEYEPKSA